MGSEMCIRDSSYILYSEVDMYIYLSWVGIGWQRRRETRQSRRQLDNEGIVFAFLGEVTMVAV